MIPIPSYRLLLAPANGRVRPATAPDAPVARGTIVAFVDAGGREHELVAPTGGTVGGYLVGDSQPVRKGTPVAWVASA